MKKLSLLFSFFILLTAFTCEDEPLDGDFVTDDNVSCETAILNTVDAALAFTGVTDDNYTELCTAYKAALEAQIQACGDPDGSLQTAVDGLGDCSNGNQQNDEDVVGTWLLTAWIGEEPIDLNNDGETSVNFLDEMDCYNNEIIVFNTDNTGVAMSTSYASFNFDIEVGTTNEFDYTIDCIQEIENTNITWSQNGNIVSVIDSGTTFDYTLAGNQMTIFVPEGFVAFSSDFTTTTSQDLTFVYTKQ